MKIGLQLYSIKDISAEQGLLAALDKAKELGYDGVEFAGLFGLTPEEVKAALDERGLECAGFHEGYTGVFESPEKYIEMCRICNAYSLCVPYFNAGSAGEWADFGKKLNEVGKLFSKNGILFGYHNHTHEFVPVDGKLPIDIVLENSENENVFFELDTRHAFVAGVNPAEYVKEHSGRVPHIPVLHTRDVSGDRDTAVGAGKVDLAGLMEVTDIPEWFVVENENFGTNEDELRDSVTYLRKVFGS